MPDQYINEVLLKGKLTQLEAIRQWSPRLISQLEILLRTGSDYDLFRINPIKYAAEKKTVENEVIDLFLHAAKLGIFEMEWHLICAWCGYTVESFNQMNNMHSHFYCDLCNAENNVSMDDYIHVTFTVLPQIRDIAYHHPDGLSIEDYYFKYHLAAGVKMPVGMPNYTDFLISLTKGLAFIPPNGKETFTFDAHPGALAARNNRAHTGALILVNGSSGQQHERTLQVRVEDGKLIFDGQQLKPQPFIYGAANFKTGVAGEIPPGKLTLEIENHTTEKTPVWVFYAPPDARPAQLEFEPFLSGKHLLTSQTFRNLYRNEVIDSHEGISIKHITFLFTDLKASTQLYDQIGDPKAYFLVRQHFDTLGKAITTHNGAIVKTIGDAVMASFMNPLDATRAAIQALAEIEAFNANITENLILKIGIHCGHSIAVTLNDRLDYFGQTVNIAARIQDLAGASEICISKHAYGHPDVAQALSTYQITEEEARVKGVGEALHIYRVVVA